MKKLLSLLLLCFALTAWAETPCFEPNDEANIFSWYSYKGYFGAEKIQIRFPNEYTTSHSDKLLVVFAYDRNIMYSFAGFFPPLGQLHPDIFFNDTIYKLQRNSDLIVINTESYQEGEDYILDYLAHDTHKQVFIKCRVIVTPYNAYSLQCISPDVKRDRFQYFLESFRIHGVG